jgi:hypothetical protein
MIASSRNTPTKLSSVAAVQRKAYWMFGAFVLAAVVASTVLIAMAAHAQGPESAPPRYSAKDVTRAFNFIDGNKDGSISRTEAASFRNVAKYFDAADANKDGSLSPEEFSNALNRPEPAARAELLPTAANRPLQSPASAAPR